MKIGILVTLTIAASSAARLAKIKRKDDRYAETFDPNNPPLGHYVPPRKVLNKKIKETLSKKHL